jgi:dihydrofolate reductase
MDKGPALLKRTMLQQLVQLKSMGIILISKNEKADFKPEENKKTVISKETIENAHLQNQTEIRIQGGSIITPLARDMAKELNILLKTF